MFSKRKSSDETQRSTRTVPSLISSDVHIVGTLSSDGEMQIDGKVDGNIRSSKVVIGGAGIISGEIVAEEVVVRGKVDGPIRGVKVKLADGARVNGDILHGSLEVETGAIFEGSIRRSDNPLEELKKLPSPETPAKAPAKKPSKSRAASKAKVKPTETTEETVQEPASSLETGTEPPAEDDAAASPEGETPPVSALSGSQAAD